MSRCQWPDGMEIRPDGVNPLDPCSYDAIEEHRCVTVRVLRCRRCGHQEIEWEPTDRWIPVSERLPEDPRFVLVCIDGHRCIAWYCAEVHTWWTQGFELREPSAWMPLPEPYREEDET